jgi:transaldolase
VGPETVTTVPAKTLEAYADHGKPADRIEENLEEARALMSQLEEVGVDMQKVTDELITEGVKTFEEAFEKLLNTIKAKAGGVTANP